MRPSLCRKSPCLHAWPYPKQRPSGLAVGVVASLPYFWIVGLIKCSSLDFQAQGRRGNLGIGGAGSR